MLTQTGDNMKINTEEVLITEKAKSYNLGYTHGLEDLKMRALVELWKVANPYRELDPDLFKLLKDAITTIEKLQ